MWQGPHTFYMSISSLYSVQQRVQLLTICNARHMAHVYIYVLLWKNAGQDGLKNLLVQVRKWYRRHYVPSFPSARKAGSSSRPNPTVLHFRKPDKHILLGQLCIADKWQTCLWWQILCTKCTRQYTWFGSKAIAHTSAPNTSLRTLLGSLSEVSLSRAICLSLTKVTQNQLSIFPPKSRQRLLLAAAAVLQRGVDNIRPLP